MTEHCLPPIDRREFLTRLGAVPAAALLGASTLGAEPAGSSAPVAPSPPAPRPSARLGLKRLCQDFHFSEYPEGVLARADAKTYVRTLKENGGEVILSFAKDHWGNCYFDTRVGRKHPAVKQDLFGEIIDEAAKLGVAVLAYMSIGWDEHSQRAHHDWRMVTWSGADQHQGGHWTSLCVNSGYGQHTVDHISELCGKYKFRGLWIDIIQYTFDSLNAPCYCAACQRLWREAGLGNAIPNPLDREARARYLDFRDAFLRRYVQAVRAAAKAAQPDLLFTHNWGGCFDLDDFIPKEAEPWGQDYVYQGYMTKFTRALANGRDFEMYTARFNQSCDFTVKPVELMRWEAANIVAHNAAIEVVDQPNIDGTLEPKAWAVIQEAYRVVDDLSPHLRGATPFAEIAVLYSHRNYELQKEIGRQSSADVAHDFAGACKLLADEHLPYDVIVEENDSADSLKPLRAVVVPNTRSLNPITVTALREWCAQGGVLLFDYLSATRDHLWRPAPQPAFGFLTPGAPSRWPVSFVRPVADLDDPFLRVNELVHFKADSQAQSLGFLTPPALEETNERWVSHKIHPGWTTETPAAVCGTFERGAYVYSSWRMFKELLATDLRAIRQFIRGSLEKFYLPTLAVDGPRTVEMIPYRTADGFRVFLTNAVIGRPAGPCTPTYGANPPPHMNIDFVLPVHNLVLWVHAPVRKARDRHGRHLSVARAGQRWKIVLPAIEQYEVIDVVV